jgi:aspartate-semialdehyde dehydrogenase
VKTPIKVGVAGATGAVGLEMLRVLGDRSFPVDLLLPMASGRVESRGVRFADRELPVVELSEHNLEGLDVVLFATGPAVSREFAPMAAAAGAVAIDNSRAFRMEPDVPLVVPEVNPDAALANRGLIANPNCSTIQMVLALKPLHDAAGVRRVVVSTYQSVSGTGLTAIDELREQSRAVLEGEPTVSEVYPTQIAFNCLPAIDDFDDEGNTREETKMILETRKIMGLPELPIAATCVRVPALRSHAMAVAVETERDIDPDRARAVLAAFPGVRVLDDPETGVYPTQLDATGNDDVWVGRVRRDPSLEHGLWLWVVTDNLRKGAATNAVQIAELLIDRDSE